MMARYIHGPLAVTVYIHGPLAVTVYIHGPLAVTEYIHGPLAVTEYIDVPLMAEPDVHGLVGVGTVYIRSRPRTVQDLVKTAPE